MNDLDRAFQKFKNAHHLAVRNDTMRGLCEHTDPYYPALKKKSDRAWSASVNAELEFVELMYEKIETKEKRK
jgi:hypothetical protein